MKALSDRFVALENLLHRWLVQYSITALRLTVGAVFLGFGILKLFPNVSPAQDLAQRTTDLLTFGVVPGGLAIVAIATLESFIGICFLAGRWMRLAVWLLALEFVGILSPIMLLSGRLFSGPHGAPTLEGQYVLKDIVLVAAGMVIAAGTFRGGRLVRDEPSLPPPLSPLGAAPRDAKRKVDIVLAATGGSDSVEEVCARAGISQTTYCQWRDAMLQGAVAALDLSEHHAPEPVSA